MTPWKLVFLWILPCIKAVDEGVYECGAHGRFEYCIDGIPGCVVGCHCHPGYYFDTETKICEPNTKLTQNFRRNYIPQPTRAQYPIFIPDENETETLPTLTTNSVIDKHVNDITRNADDLGDWLYNQFFKTIENQVINNTNKGSLLTRRSERGSNSKHNKPKRRARKRDKKKHKKKRKGMKEKLLKITEDDSLFQSSESSEPDDDSTSSDLSRSSSSFDSNSDEDHGHKKILLINKKPRPPLPSFIFLPHMNTPFFPPIGLPPPPIMPMYPMVPVPPVVPPPPMLPNPDCEENTTSTTVTTTTKVVTSTLSTTTISDAPKTDSDAEETATDVQYNNGFRMLLGLPRYCSASGMFVETRTDGFHAIMRKKAASMLRRLRDSTNSILKTIAYRFDCPIQKHWVGAPALERSSHKVRKKKKIKPIQSFVAEDDEEDPLFNGFKTTRDNRQKLLQQLRQKINNPTLKRKNKLFKNYIEQFIPPDTAMDTNNVEDMVLKNENPLIDNYDEMPEQENVDFKYLSQLIHRVNQSQAQNIPIEGIPNNSMQKFGPDKWSTIKNLNNNVPIESGRRMNQRMSISRNGQLDDTYYSNLGRQIASLIRSIDADNERQLNIEIEKVQQKSDDQPFFGENVPRTFWERSVRSPLKLMYPYRNKYNNLKHSNELLYNIENKVETVASTMPTLSLQEIENMIKVMETAQTRFQSNTQIKKVNSPSKTLNINLWPQEIKHSKNLIKSSARPAFFNTNKKFTDYSNSTKPKTVNKPNRAMQNHDSLINRDNKHKLKDRSRLGIQMQPAVKSSSTSLYFISNKTLRTYPQTILNQNRAAESNSDNFRDIYSINSKVIKYKNLRKYFFEDNNHYSFQNDDSPIHYSEPKVIRKHLAHSFKVSPYFREINDVGYIPLQ